MTLNELDCNCNNCKHMIRNLNKFKHHNDLDRGYQLAEFERKKQKAFDDANALVDEKQKKSMLFKANKMRFQFDQRNIVNYGTCSKFNKEVSFIPVTCQIETQGCWESR